jgi:hypothetical protein
MNYLSPANVSVPRNAKRQTAIHDFPNQTEEVSVRQDAGTIFERTSK